MRSDVLAALSGTFPSRIPTKETLNHPGFVRRVSGLDSWDRPAEAFAEAWRRLSIDVHVPAPSSAPRPRVPGGTWEEGGWRYADIGVFPTAVRTVYLPELDHGRDDLATSTGPVFAPGFYDRWIFPRYERIFEPAIRAGRKIVFVSDGNIDAFLERLLALPIAGIMYENPATPFGRVLATWGEAGRGFIGGIDTALLSRASPDEVAGHARDVVERGRRYPGFVLSSCGGLYGDVPVENLLAYFVTRDRMGIPAEV